MSMNGSMILSFLGGAFTASAFHVLKGKAIKGSSGSSDPQLERVHLLKKLELELSNLTKNLKIDFASLALYDPVNMEMRWRLARGELNNRYLSIAIKLGRGVAGTVLQTKRPMLIASFPEDVPEDPLEYPILMVEKLKSAAAVPLLRENNVFGVLLVGQRKQRSFNQDELKTIERYTVDISKIFHTHVVPASMENPKRTAIQTPLVQYLIREKEKSPSQLQFELLDQQITQISERLQILLIEVIHEIFGKLIQKPSDQLKISVERKNEQQMAIEITINKRVDQPKQMFSHLLEKIGWMKGSVEMYNEPAQFKFIMNFSIALLFADQPWIG